MTQRQPGLPTPSAADALHGLAISSAGIQPLPAGSPGRADGAQLGISDTDPITFFVIGDSGGVKAPGPQNAVSYAMEESPAPAFVYHVGDVVYFNGDASEYGPQFYEPYAHLAAPVVGVPGNHDGDVTDDPSREPLDTFLHNFCDITPSIPDADPQMEYGRHTQTQPWCDWALCLKAVTIIGLYSNVPSGGHLESSQTDWLAAELAAAPTDRPCIVAIHHPPASVDQHHGGSQKMSDALDAAFIKSGRCPEMVLSGHVHDQQRFTRTLDGHAITYEVIGNSGYHNLHKLASDAKPGMSLPNGFVFQSGDDSHYGFLTLTVGAGKIAGEYVAVTPGMMPDGQDAQVVRGLDSFTIGSQ